MLRSHFGPMSTALCFPRRTCAWWALALVAEARCLCVPSDGLVRCGGSEKGGRGGADGRWLRERPVVAGGGWPPTALGSALCARHDVRTTVATAPVVVLAGWAVPALGGRDAPPAADVAGFSQVPGGYEVIALIAPHLGIGLQLVSVVVRERSLLVAPGRWWGWGLRSAPDVGRRVVLGLGRVVARRRAAGLGAGVVLPWEGGCAVVADGAVVVEGLFWRRLAVEGQGVRLVFRRLLVGVAGDDGHALGG